MNFTKPLALFFFLLSTFIFAQTPEDRNEPLSLNSGTLSNQFEYVLTKSGSWGKEGISYRVVRANWLTELKAHTLDSLEAIRNDLVAAEITVESQAQEIADLKTSLATANESLSKAKEQKDTISILGAKTEKSSYKAIMWGVIVILLLVLLFFIYKFKNSNAVTKHAKQALEDLEEEFEEHRKTAVEREQKVRRQLQDEIIKQKNIKPKK
ncbi:tRNA (guanine-N1)-methyltransferase [Mariniflexile sp.]|uniref:tRNA (guanine-N1)-methyltransferase n=1 Tax=Mariniflexile sp. TaxID=1979402 RepID=UPI0035663429